MGDVNHEAYEEYMKLSNELQSELIASEGQELFDANEHWVNNPLITPINKVALFEEAIARAEKKTEERIIALLEKHMCLYLYGYTECGGDSSTCVGKEEMHNRKLLELIRGENK